MFDFCALLGLSLNAKKCLTEDVSFMINEIEVMYGRWKLKDVHPALYVFRQSLGSCKFNYLLHFS